MVDRTPYVPYGQGVYRREVSVAFPASDLAVGEVIDDFHHFRAQIRHDGRELLEVRGETPRYPWATCAGASVPLQRLVGMPLEGAGSLRAAASYTPWRAQCTHLFDAAAIAIARTSRSAGPVTYRITAPDCVDSRGRIELARDAEPLLAWELDGLCITSPEPFAGHLLRGGSFADWAESTLDPELAEAVLVLQRAATISGARRIDLERIDRADLVLPQNPMGQCHTYTPGIVERGFRMYGSVRNLTAVEDIRSASTAPQRSAAGSSA
jgi:hypothetical protein